MTPRPFFIPLLLLVSLSAFAQIQTFSVPVGEFAEFTVADDINVVYRCSTDSAGYATFTCSPEVAHAITFSNHHAKLKIQNDTQLPDSILPEITIYSSVLSHATNWGKASVTLDSIAPCAEFKLKVIGNGHIVARHIKATKVDAAVQAGNGRIFISGAAQTASLQLMSAGTIEAGNLKAANVRCRMYGTGNIDCFATESLEVGGLGSGKVYYRGTSTKIKTRSLGIKVFPVEAVQ